VVVFLLSVMHPDFERWRANAEGEQSTGTKLSPRSSEATRAMGRTSSPSSFSRSGF
jgi:hypothetical protein